MTKKAKMDEKCKKTTFLDVSPGKYGKMSKKVENDEKGSNYDSKDQKALKIK
jgi:hypothetical protein